MSSTFEQECPLCTGKANYEFKNFHNFKHFLCYTCREYVISTGAERRLPKHISKWRTTLSDHAKKSEGRQILVITLASISLRKKGVAYPVFNAEFVDRKAMAL